MPSIRLSPVGDLISKALLDVPKLPAFYNRKDIEVKGKTASNTKNFDKSKKMDRFFSKFMLERLKKSSILNHDCFKKEDIDYKAQVAKNYSKYQEIIHRASRRQ